MGYGTHLEIMNSAENRYVKSLAARWLVRAMESGVKLDDDFFGCFLWLIDDSRAFRRKLEKEAETLAKKNGAEKKADDLREVASHHRNHHLDSALENFLSDYPDFSGFIMGLIREDCQKISENGGVAKNFKNAAKKLKECFGISEAAITICEFIFIKENFRSVERYFEEELELVRYGQRRLFAHVLGLSPAVLHSALDELSRGGLIESENKRYALCLHAFLFSFWDDDCTKNTDLFSRPLKGPALPLADFCLPADDLAHIRRLLESPRREPLHILLYGPPGTGKSSLARTLTKVCGLKAWSVMSREDDGEEHRRASLIATLNLAAKHPGAVVVVDEAERLLDTGRQFGVHNKDKAWLNDFLEQPGRRIIWISNQVKHIDQAVRRRFSYSLYFPELGVRERTIIWRQALARHRVKSRLNDAAINALAVDYPLEAAHINEAVTQARDLYETKNFRPALERVLSAKIALRHNGEPMKAKAKAADDFTLDGVCLEGSAEALLKQCRRVDETLRQNNTLRPGGATMLFYGPPGTGKSALARHIARELNRKCLVQRASDLLSPYVGMAEQQVAAAFRQAEKEGAVLVIDEADTFLYSRETAQRSWEVSLVNEFLTALEECRGFCVCTSNRLESLDAAALRRFSHKVAFTYASPAQARALYSKLLAPLCPAPLTRDFEQELLTMKQLSPGDFHAVRSQYDSPFIEEGEVTHQKLLAALHHEVELKKPDSGRVMGFCSY